MKTTAALLVATLLVKMPCTAQPPAAQDLFHQGVHFEEVKGDLEAAIEQYEKVLSRFGGDRAVAARAQLGIGRCYERMGRKSAEQARAAYEQVLARFAEQVDPVRAARSRLEALDAAPHTTEPVFTQVFGYAGANLSKWTQQGEPAWYDFSPDGREVVLYGNPEGADVAAYFICDRSGTLVRPLFDAFERGSWYGGPRWSPDGERIAFLEADPVDPKPGDVIPVATGAILIVSTEGEVLQRVELERALVGFCNLEWGGDGRTITVHAPMQGGKDGFRTIDLVDGSVRSVTLDARPRASSPTMQFDRRVRFTDISPDGRWLLINDRDGGEQHEDRRALWLVRTDGAAPAVRITDGPGADVHGTWSLDGRAVYFVSDRAGTPNIWRVRIDPASGRPLSEPTQVTFYRDTKMRHPRMLATGDLAFVVVKTTSAIHVAVPETPQASRVVARGTGPQLSPDGATVYFVGEGPDEVGIFAVGVDGSGRRRLTSKRPTSDYWRLFHVSPDGRRLAYFSREQRTTRLHVVATDGGAERVLVEFEFDRGDIVPAWSPDGTRIAYAAGTELSVISPEGGEPEVLARLDRWEEWSPRWSPDGTLIAAFGFPGDGEENAVYVVPAEGGEHRRLTTPADAQYKEGLAWHPDGTRLTYMEYRGKSGDGTRVVHLDGRPSTVLLNLPRSWDYVGTWAPDGREYFFVSVEVGCGDWELRAFDERTGDVRRISSPEGGAVENVPAWSRDGRAMTWAAARRTVQLWTVSGFD